MKSGLNIICFLIIAVMAFFFGQMMPQELSSFNDGFNEGWSGSSSSKEGNLSSVSLVPYTFTEIADSIYNAKTDSYVPAYYRKVDLELNQPESRVFSIFRYTCQIFQDFFVLFAVLYFIRFIAKVNKGEIFSRRSIRRLRRIGILFTLGFLVSLFPTIYTYITVKEAFAIENYRILLFDMFNLMPLLLGLIAFMVAQIFAIALRMQEEKELTI